MLVKTLAIQLELLLQTTNPVNLSYIWRDTVLTVVQYILNNRITEKK